MPQVLFVDNKSPSYAQNTSQCEFFIKPFNHSNWGLLDSPRHSLPPNTSCKYHFQGAVHQTVWLSFIKYHAASTDPNAYHLSNQCNARLRIWDKVISADSKKVRDSSVVVNMGISPNLCVSDPKYFPDFACKLFKN